MNNTLDMNNFNVMLEVAIFHYGGDSGYDVNIFALMEMVIMMKAILLVIRVVS